MTRILVPYHLDEYVPDLDPPVDPELTLGVDVAESDGDPWLVMSHLFNTVADVVGDDIRRGRRPVVASADCLTSLGIVAGLQRAGIEPAVVWFDAHGDVQTLETTASGYLGGMPIRLLVGYRPELIADALNLRPVPEERIALVDARDLDPPEEQYLADAAICRLAVPDVGPDTVPDGPIYLHLDVDVIDPGELPGLRYPTPGGPGLAEVVAALRRVLATGRVAAVGLACTWYPNRGASVALRGPLAAALAG